MDRFINNFAIFREHDLRAIIDRPYKAVPKHGLSVFGADCDKIGSDIAIIIRAETIVLSARQFTFVLQNSFVSPILRPSFFISGTGSLAVISTPSLRVKQSSTCSSVSAQ